MKIASIVAACAAAALAVPATALAADAAAAPCPAKPADACVPATAAAFRPEADVRALVEKFLRYRVERVDTRGGCYAVLASDRGGTPYVVTFRGSDLRMVSRYVAKDLP